MPSEVRTNYKNFNLQYQWISAVYWSHESLLLENNRNCIQLVLQRRFNTWLISTKTSGYLGKEAINWLKQKPILRQVIANRFAVVTDSHFYQTNHCFIKCWFCISCSIFWWLLLHQRSSAQTMASFGKPATTYVKSRNSTCLSLA